MKVQGCKFVLVFLFLGVLNDMQDEGNTFDLGKDFKDEIND